MAAIALMCLSCMSVRCFSRPITDYTQLICSHNRFSSASWGPYDSKLKSLSRLFAHSTGAWCVRLSCLLSNCVCLSCLPAQSKLLGVFARAGSCRTVSASADFLPTQQVLGVCARAVSCGAVSASAGPKLGHCQGRQGQDSAAGGVHRQLWSSCHYCCCTACSQVSCSASNVSLSHQRVRIVMALLCGDGVQSAESTM